jgi:[acyl-carrier-protein] S-malonyltransferase
MRRQRRLAFVFPGQGCQFVGMGRDLHDNFKGARHVFEEASAALGLDVARLCFEAPAGLLDRPSCTRPATCTVSLAALRAFADEAGALEPAFLAGHSLGEYTACIVAGVLPMAVALRGLRAVGEAMEGVPGTTVAIVGMKRDEVRSLCAAASSAGLVTPACFNAPDQVVIGGERPAVTLAMHLARERGGRAVRLPIGAPCHTPLMARVEPAFRAAFRSAAFSPGSVPVISNVGPQLHGGGMLARELLASHLTMPVEWDRSLDILDREGVEALVEFGPAPVLTRLLARHRGGMSAQTVHDRRSLQETTVVLRETIGAGDVLVAPSAGRQDEPGGVSGTPGRPGSAG